MRKLVSAATSLVMAATMVSAVAPVVAGAADTTKGFSILAYKDATLPSGVTADGATLTVSADAIAAGDVTIPVGIYVNENTPDIRSISVQATVNSDNADVSKIKFPKAYTPSVDKFFDSEKTYKAPSGDEFTTDTVVSFAGAYDDIDGYLATGMYGAVVVDEFQKGANTDNAYFGLSWSNGGTKYKEWFGGKSDAYPVVVFDVKLPKGLSNGTYTIDYCNYMTKNGAPSCLIESIGSGKHDTLENKNLDLNTLTINVGDAAPAQTTTAAPAQTTTTSDAPAQSTTTTTSSSKPVTPTPTDADYKLYVGDKDGNKGPLKGEAGGKVNAYIYCEQLNDAARATAFSIDLVPDTIVISAFGKKSAAMGTNTNSNVKEGNINAANPGSDGDGITVSGNLATIVFEVPAGTADGLYAMNITRHYFATKTPLEQPEGWNVYLEEETAYVQVGDAVTPVATTTTKAPAQSTTTTAAPAQTTTKAPAQTTTTDAPAQSTTTTKKADGDGTLLYGDTNCDGVVKINDVVLLNKYLNDAKSYAIKDQGKKNADCYNPKDGAELTAEDSKAIIQSIVHLVTLPVNK